MAHVKFSITIRNAVKKFSAITRESTPSAHPAAKPNVCKWLCTDNKTWRAGDRASGTWFNCDNEVEANAVVKAMAGLTLPQIVSVRYTG